MAIRATQPVPVTQPAAAAPKPMRSMPTGPVRPGGLNSGPRYPRTKGGFSGKK